LVQQKTSSKFPRSWKRRMGLPLLSAASKPLFHSMPVLARSNLSVTDPRVFLMGLSTSRFPASWAHNAEPIARVARTIAFLMPHLRTEESKRRAAKRHTWNRLGGG